MDFYDAPTAIEFWDAFARVKDQSERSAESPILHLETHGLADTNGLSLADGTAVGWEELRIALAGINQFTGCSLFVTLAACHGAHFGGTLDIQSRAPCRAIMGPAGVVSPPDLTSSYSAYFLELLRSDDAEAALQALAMAPERRAKYFLTTAEDFFAAVLQTYRGSLGSAAKMNDRVDRFASMLEKMGMPTDKSWIKSTMGGDERQILLGMFDRFFFVDKNPKNRDRFASALRALATNF